MLRRAQHERIPSSISKTCPLALSLSKGVSGCFQRAADYRQFVERVPGAQGQAHAILAGGGHFLQEDVPEEFTRALLDWLGPRA